ncbi:MAG: PD40 domain-containing protein [Nanoarchaeota archaeon]|nr:PD40 domain-containing protein [Nanoarchaeota archaeon]
MNLEGRVGFEKVRIRGRVKLGWWLKNKIDRYRKVVVGVTAAAILFGGAYFSISHFYKEKNQAELETRLLEEKKKKQQLNSNEDVIVFVSNRDGDYEIYKMLSDGSKTTKLTDNFIADEQPYFSFDKKRIVYVSQNGSDYDLSLMNSDGTDKKTIKIPDNQFTPSFSANGKNILFETYLSGNGTWQIETYSDEEGNKTVIKNLKHRPFPRLNFNSDEFTYTTSDSPNGYKYDCRIISSNLRTNLKKTIFGNNSFVCPSVFKQLKFNLFGSKIIYFYTGTNQVRFVDKDGHEIELDYGRWPAFSPKSDKIVYSKKIDNAWKLMVYDLKSQEEKQITQGLWDDIQPDWR